MMKDKPKTPEELAAMSDDEIDTSDVMVRNFLDKTGDMAALFDSDKISMRT